MNGFEDFQKLGQKNFDAAVKSANEVNKGFQAIASIMNDYTRKTLEDSTLAMEKFFGAKSFEQAVAIQTEFAKKAYDDYVSQVSKLGEMYSDLAKDAYKPVENALSKKP